MLAVRIDSRKAFQSRHLSSQTRADFADFANGIWQRLV
jgi:hypothetical protein